MINHDMSFCGDFLYGICNNILDQWHGSPDNVEHLRVLFSESHKFIFCVCHSLQLVHRWWRDTTCHVWRQYTRIESSTEFLGCNPHVDVIVRGSIIKDLHRILWAPPWRHSDFTCTRHVWGSIDVNASWEHRKKVHPPAIQPPLDDTVASLG